MLMEDLLCARYGTKHVTSLCRKQFHKVGIIVFISQSGKLRPQEVKLGIQGDRVVWPELEPWKFVATSLEMPS